MHEATPGPEAGTQPDGAAAPQPDESVGRAMKDRVRHFNQSLPSVLQRAASRPGVELGVLDVILRLRDIDKKLALLVQGVKDLQLLPAVPAMPLPDEQRRPGTEAPAQEQRQQQQGQQPSTAAGAPVPPPAATGAGAGPSSSRPGAAAPTASAAGRAAPTVAIALGGGAPSFTAPAPAATAPAAPAPAAALCTTAAPTVPAPAAAVPTTAAPTVPMPAVPSPTAAVPTAVAPATVAAAAAAAAGGQASAAGAPQQRRKQAVPVSAPSPRQRRRGRDEREEEEEAAAEERVVVVGGSPSAAHQARRPRRWPEEPGDVNIPQAEARGDLVDAILAGSSPEGAFVVRTEFKFDASDDSRRARGEREYHFDFDSAFKVFSRWFPDPSVRHDQPRAIQSMFKDAKSDSRNNELWATSVPVTIVKLGVPGGQRERRPLAVTVRVLKTGSSLHIGLRLESLMQVRREAGANAPRSTLAFYRAGGEVFVFNETPLRAGVPQP